MGNTNPICEALQKAKDAAKNSQSLTPDQRLFFEQCINLLMKEKHCDGSRS
jgi:hypothetical protein